MTNSLDQIFEKLWKNYTEITPQAAKVHALFHSQGFTIKNDHIAFRTFSDSQVGLDKLAELFVQNGYCSKGEYHFKEKKLFAKHFEHSSESYPKVFVSELLIEKCSQNLQKTIQHLLKQSSMNSISSSELVFLGRPWQVSYETYEELLQESEYAAWVSAFGFRANHFTVDINSISRKMELSQINELLKTNGFKLNTSGGEIKGNPREFLEQSSTLAESVPVKFSDGVQAIPSCYYEFAKRYPLPNGKIYQGFVAASADKLFESTKKP